MYVQLSEAKRYSDLLSKKMIQPFYKVKVRIGD